jgi:hypothetical protein
MYGDSSKTESIYYCSAVTTVDGKRVECEKHPDHDGDHAGYVPEDAPGLTWDRHDWSGDEGDA